MMDDIEQSLLNAIMNQLMPIKSLCDLVAAYGEGEFSHIAQILEYLTNDATRNLSQICTAIRHAVGDIDVVWENTGDNFTYDNIVGIHYQTGDQLDKTLRNKGLKGGFLIKFRLEDQAHKPPTKFKTEVVIEDASSEDQHETDDEMLNMLLTKREEAISHNTRSSGSIVDLRGKRHRATDSCVEDKAAKAQGSKEKGR